MGRLTGKVAMVTGSGGEHGFGRAIAGRLASDGADLILTDVERTGVRAIPGTSAGSWGGLDAVADEVRKHGGRALTALADVRSAAQVDAVVARALETFGHIDILVNNAGAPAGPDRAAVVELSEEAWDLVVGINLKGTFLCSRAVARTMLERRVHGRIVNISSQWGKVGGPRRLLRVEVRCDRVDAVARPGARAGRHHRERRVSGRRRHRASRPSRPPA